MSHRRADRAFAAFQRDGDPRRVAVVFDATAAELLRVARYLAGSADRAEDLVQQTFLKAIEGRDRYDATSPVLPWLLGILANEARNERRRERRTPPAEARANGERDPAALAEHDEFRAALARCVRSTHEPYREVLLLHLEHGLSCHEIADVTRRKPATVRTQLARGLELLRRVLPAGGASGVAVAVATSGRGLAAVRADVMGSIGAGAATAVAPSVSSALLGVMMTKKILTVAALVALAWLLLVPLLRQGVSPDDARSAASSTADVDGGGQRAAAQRAGDEVLRVAASSAGDEEERVAASLVVRVRFEHGAPAEGIGVFVGGGAQLAPGVERRSDERGDVLIEGLRPGAVSIQTDRGVNVTTQLRAGANECGVVLPRGAVVHGVVLELLGDRPVPGAEVFVVCAEHPERALRVGVADGEGRFELHDMGVGASLFARAPGWQPGDAKRTAVTARPGEHQQLTLRVGVAASRLTGSVRRATGEPCAFATVAVACDEQLRRGGPAAARDPAHVEREAFVVRADADGRFVCDEAPAGELWLIARAVDDEQAVALQRVDVAAVGETRCDLRLSVGAELTGFVHDEAGAPIAGLPVVVEWRGTDAFGRLEGGLADALSGRLTKTGADGSYVLRGLLPGEQKLRPGARWSRSGRIDDPLRQGVTVALAPGERLRRDLVVRRLHEQRVRLLDARGEPVVGWAVTVGDGRELRRADLERQKTDEGGRVVLPDVSADATFSLAVHPPRVAAVGGWTVDVMPARRFAACSRSEQEIVLQLATDDVPTASLRGRVLDVDGSPRKLSIAELRREGWSDAYRLPPAADGVFAQERLAAGTYWLQAGGRGDPRLGPFVLAPGQQLDVGDVRLPATGRVVATVTGDDGAAITRLRGRLQATDGSGREWLLHERGGEFASGVRMPGTYRLVVSGDDVAPAHRLVDVVAGEDAQVAITCARQAERRFVMQLPVGAEAPALDARGWVLMYTVRAPIDGDWVTVRTGNSGSLEFGVSLAPGAYRFDVYVLGFDRHEHDVVLGEAAGPPIVLVVP